MKEYKPKQQSLWCQRDHSDDSDPFSKPYYYGKVGRLGAQRLLESGIDGSFLVRESESVQNGLAISIRKNNLVHHYRIHRYRCSFGNEWLFVTPSVRFKSLNELVLHHSVIADGLVDALKFPLPKVTDEDWTNLAKDKWSLCRTDLRVQKRIGSGQYGEVYKAHINSLNLTVALKASCGNSSELEQEIYVMKKLKHPNILKLVRVCSRNTPQYILTEYMSEGSLIDFLQQSNYRHVDQISQLNIARQVCDGMRYLTQQKIIHRDLAARNCFMSSQKYSLPFGVQKTKLIVKIGDFGLAQHSGKNGTYYGQKVGFNYVC